MSEEVRVSERMRWMMVLLVALSALGASACERETYERPVGGEPMILVDLYHTRLQNPVDHRLNKQSYAYQGVHGYARVFDHLDANGYTWGTIRELTLSKARLSGYKVLFINLLHTQRPDFTADEIKAIQEFVFNGGGLFIIADHTNVYRHAERVNRVLAPMGIEVDYTTAIDYPPHTVSGLGWIAVTDLEDHPTNEGLELISLQTGGTMRATKAGALGTARLSESGLGDFWNEDEGGGFYGDWTFNGDESKEPRGPSPVVAAATYGQGRVVVAGDQNMYGDAWVHFGDNFAHVMNIFEWIAQREDDPVPLRDLRPKGVNLGIDIRLSGREPGRGSTDGYYTFFVNLNRDPEVSGRGIMRLDNSDDALILPTLRVEPTAEDIANVKQYLESGKRVVVMFEPTKMTTPTAQLLQALAPELSIVNGDKTVTFGADAAPGELAEASKALSGQITRTATFSSPAMGLGELEMASYTVRTISADEKARDPYLLTLTSTWGEPFIQATADGKTWDVARRKAVYNGELIVVLQDGFWRGRTIGTSETEKPSAEGEPAVKLQYKLMDYLKTPLR